MNKEQIFEELDLLLGNGWKNRKAYKKWVANRIAGNSSKKSSKLLENSLLDNLLMVSYQSERMQVLDTFVDYIYSLLEREHKNGKQIE